MSFEGAFKVSGFEFPYFDGAIFGSGGKLGILWMEGK